MELICATLCAIALFICGALTAMTAAGQLKPLRREKRERSGPAAPAAPSDFERDLSALLHYMPGEEQEET